MSNADRRYIEVWADWVGLGEPTLMGTLNATRSRGKEIFSFEYEPKWLTGPNVQILDPSLGLFEGPQYAPADQDNFGLFLDSCPDRWGRVLMRRREAHLARSEERQERTLLESDYLLGVHDSHRMGALRFRATTNGPFLDDNQDMASPPWTSLRELESVSLQLEREGARNNPDYAKWLRMLIAPGGSLGGARPKASVIDNDGALWIAKFPSMRDGDNSGAWEGVIHELARRSQIETAEARTRKLGSEHHTFLAKRFDRAKRTRVHFVSAMTLLQRKDGDDASSGSSYLELAELIMKSGSRPDHDLEELWRRLAFYVCVSNTDDHLRNHGFLLDSSGWQLAPAYDMNPNPSGSGLKLNISETDNSLDLELVRKVAPFFRVDDSRAEEIIRMIVESVRRWREVATTHGISNDEQQRMASAFASAEC